MTKYARLNFGPHWQMTNENLIELIDLVPDEELDWSPAPEDWTIKRIALHIILARYHYPIEPQEGGPGIQEVVLECQTKEGLKKHFGISWEMVARLISDEAKLDARQEPLTANAPEYNEPEVYDGHYVAYHRMAHDLHHRSTIIGYMGKRGISLDGHRVRPL